MSEPVTDLSNVRSSVELANGLPNAHYVDPASLRGGKSRRSCLLAMGRARGGRRRARTGRRGAAMTFLGMPLLLSARQGRRGTRVPEHLPPSRHDPGRRAPKDRRRNPLPLSFLVLLDQGQRWSRPRMWAARVTTPIPAIRRDDLGLIEVRSHIWRDVVWINVSGDAPDFEEAMADVIARWREFDLPVHHGGAGQPLHARGCQQLETRGRELLRKLSPALGSSRPQQLFHAGGSLSYRGTGPVFRPGHDGLSPADQRQRRTFPRFRRCRRQVERTGRILSRSIPMCFSALTATMPSPSSSSRKDANERPSICISTIPEPKRMKGSMRVTHSSGRASSKKTSLSSKACRRVATPTFDGGRFSPVMDSPTHCFHAWVAGKVEAHRGAAKAAE